MSARIFWVTGFSLSILRIFEFLAFPTSVHVQVKIVAK